MNCMRKIKERFGYVFYHAIVCKDTNIDHCVIVNQLSITGLFSRIVRFDVVWELIITICTIVCSTCLNFQLHKVSAEPVCWSEKPLPTPSSPRTSTPLPLTSSNYNIRQQINELRIRNSSPKLSMRNLSPPVKSNTREAKSKSVVGSEALSSFSSINNFSSRHYLNQERL